MMLGFIYATLLEEGSLTTTRWSHIIEEDNSGMSQHYFFQIQFVCY